MTTTVILSWDDPEDAATFLCLREEYLRQGWLPDPSMAELLELVRAGEVVNDEDAPKTATVPWCRRCERATSSVPCPLCDGPACAGCGRCPPCDGPVKSGSKEGSER